MNEDFLTRNKHIIISISIIIFLIIAILSISSPHLENDEIIYKTLAIKLAHFQSYSLQGSSILKYLPHETYATSLFFKPPVYIAFLSLIYKLLGNFGFSISPAITYGLLLFVIYKTAYIITKSERYALKALLILLSSSLLLFSSQQIHIDLFVTLMISISFYFLMKWKDTNRYAFSFTSGIFLSTAVLTNYSSVIFYPLFLAFILLSQKRKRAHNIFTFIVPSFFIWLYNVFFIHHMTVQQLIDKPDVFALSHFPFLNYVYHRPFYFYFLNIFLINPVYFLLFTLFKKDIRSQVLKNYQYLFYFLCATILLIFISLTYFGISGGTYQMRYVLMSVPFLSLLLTIIPFGKMRVSWILFWVFVLFNFSLVYYNITIRSAEVFNYFEILTHFH